MNGKGKVSLQNVDCTLEGNFVNGKLHGPVRGLTSKGKQFDISESVTGVNFFTHEAIFLLSYKNFEPIKIKSSKKVFAKNSVIAN